MGPVTLLLTLYDETSPFEQPAAISRLVDRAWKPLLRALTAAAQARVAVHLSGATCDWLDANDPETLGCLRSLAETGQVEVLAGPYYGAVPQSLPERDALAQFRLSLRWLRDRLGVEARGSWLPLGAWDPGLPRLLARAGLRYTFVDQGLIASGGHDLAKLDGWYVTERGGAVAGVFPLDRRVEALVPYAPPGLLVAELLQRGERGVRSVTAGISVCRLGLLPKTHELCWEGSRPWVREFLRLLRAQSAWLKTGLPGAVAERQRPTGRAYPAAGTFPPVAAAALPAGPGNTFTGLLDLLRTGTDPVLADAEPWITGPPWEAFLARYDEANRLHKRALRASRIVGRLRREAERDDSDIAPGLVDDLGVALLRGQSAVHLHTAARGGLGRGAMRHRAWRTLLDVERRAQAALGQRDATLVQMTDYDCDGLTEVLVTTPHMQAVIAPGQGGGLVELHLDGLGNLVNTLTRREESWHRDLHHRLSLPALVRFDGGDERVVVQEIIDEEDEPDDDEPTDEAPTSPGRPAERPIPLPEVPCFATFDGPVNDLLHVDHHVRASFVEHFFGPETGLDNLRMGQHRETGDFLVSPWERVTAERDADGAARVLLARDGTVSQDLDKRLVGVRKHYRFPVERARVEVRYEVNNRYHDPVSSRFAVELNLNLDSVRSPDRFVFVYGHRRVELDEAFEAPCVEALSLMLDDVQTEVRVHSDRAATAYIYPIENVIRTAEGFERAFQGTCVVFAWELDLWGYERDRFGLDLEVIRTSR